MVDLARQVREHFAIADGLARGPAKCIPAQPPAIGRESAHFVDQSDVDHRFDAALDPPMQFRRAPAAARTRGTPPPARPSSNCIC